MVSFEPALEVVLWHEGGDRFTDRPGDRGGPTKWGITAATLGRWRHLGRPATADEVRGITRAEAADIYQTRYWAPCRCASMPTQGLATKLFDMAANLGPMAAVRIFQAAVNRVAGTELHVDGLLGEATLSVLRRCDPAALLAAVCASQRQRYLAILDAAAKRNDPTQEQFRVGWLKRAAYPLDEELA